MVYTHGSPLIPAAGKGFAELQTLRSRHWVAGQEERVAVVNPRQLLQIYGVMLDSQGN